MLHPSGDWFELKRTNRVLLGNPRDGHSKQIYARYMQIYAKAQRCQRVRGA